ncbi:caspase family protein [Alphaproteobacteria bacterium]|nr:caspase family protein [Alphaproteobacteria bacterium]
MLKDKKQRTAQSAYQKEKSIPNGFTLFSAASNEQISHPLEEAKHGMFSYFLMKGMEGDADTNNDNKITAQELHNYVKENVTQQSSGSQTPELQGNKNRVLVQFN